MTRNLDVATLRTFITVVDTRGVTRASNKLHMTQSAVSMQLKRLEETMGCALLKRNSSGMCPTAAGEQLLSYARRLVRLNDEAVERLLQRDEVAEVRFGVPPDVVEPHVPGILKRFVQRYPHASVRLFCKHSADLLDRFRRGKLDVIITTEQNTHPACRQLLQRDLVWTGAVNGRAWLQDPLPLAFTRISMFKASAIAALDAAGIAWVNALDSGNNTYSATVACAADLGIRADIQGFEASGMQEVNDPGQRLPALPTYFVNLYVAEPAGTSSDAAFLDLAHMIEAQFGGVDQA
jgi:DNA-binding transcriptional LysR family regulator